MCEGAHDVSISSMKYKWRVVRLTIVAEDSALLSRGMAWRERLTDGGERLCRLHCRGESSPCAARQRNARRRSMDGWESGKDRE